MTPVFAAAVTALAIPPAAVLSLHTAWRTDAALHGPVPSIAPGSCAVASLVGAAIVYSAPLQPAAAATLAIPLVAAALCDAAACIIPDILVAALWIYGLVHGHDAGTRLPITLIGTTVAGIVLLAIRLVGSWRLGRPPLGLGDIKLIAAMTVWLNPFDLVLVLGCASLLIIAVHLVSREAAYPFAPYFAGGLAALYLLRSLAL